MFFFRKKTLLIDCFTPVEGAFKYAKPKLAAEFVPDWWKELPKTYVPKGSFWPEGTLRACPGIIDLYKRGIMLSAWCDAAVEIGKKGTEEYRWQFSDHYHNAFTHAKEQIGTHFNSKEYAHLKLSSPWVFRATDTTRFVWQDPTWNTLYNFEYKLLSGMTEFKYQHQTNVNLIFKRREETYTNYIRYKTPLAHLIPLADDKKIKIKCHHISEKEFGKFYNTRMKFVGHYKEVQKEKKGCPV